MVVREVVQDPLCPVKWPQAGLPSLSFRSAGCKVLIPMKKQKNRIRRENHVLRPSSGMSGKLQQKHRRAHHRAEMAQDQSLQCLHQRGCWSFVWNLYGCTETPMQLHYISLMCYLFPVVSCAKLIICNLKSRLCNFSPREINSVHLGSHSGLYVNGRERSEKQWEQEEKCKRQPSTLNDRQASRNVRVAMRQPEWW